MSVTSADGAPGDSTGRARYAVIGAPVEHSLSPILHTSFAAATGEALEYRLLPAPVDGFRPTAAAFFRAGGRGLNVTLPFKPEAAAWVDSLDEAAAAAEAVNTVAADSAGRLHGYNTDGAGLVQDLTVNLGWPIDGARVLLLGAGGSARGVLRPLLAAGVAELVVANRTPARAEDLARLDPRVRGVALEAARGPFDVVLNSTSASIAGVGALVAADCVHGARCYDLLYAPGDTAFMDWCRRRGARAVSDGFGMLIEQAAEAFAIWRGLRPKTGALLSDRDALFAAQEAIRQSKPSAVPGGTGAAGRDRLDGGDADEMHNEPSA
ncbi:MAG: shikimate dehydrogenase [Pseudomonadota bacterium]